MPHSILIEHAVNNHPRTRSILSRFPEIKPRYIRSITDAPETTTHRTMILAKHNGTTVVPCPGTPAYLCCNYHIINIGIGCAYRCTYCFLHQYRNTYGHILYMNIEDAVNTLRHMEATGALSFKRIGTGEFTDSLLYDEITGYSRLLIQFFAQKNLCLELKTKSAHINHLLDLNHGKKTVMA
ncbi:MAG: hypothetical protein GF384_07535, partial [Elusimicrobia bacterium]|nr:hypothetical protein [Elusimicrobiota bacterium]